MIVAGCDVGALSAKAVVMKDGGGGRVSSPAADPARGGEL